MTQKLQRSLPHFAHQTNKRDSHQHHHGHHGRAHKDGPVPAHIKRRQAVRAVVQIFHGRSKERETECGAKACRKNTHNRGQQQVVQHKLATAITTRQQRANNRALFFDSCRGQHHKSKRHDDHNNLEERKPHARVARNIIGCITNTLVGIGVNQLVHGGTCVGKGAHHVFLDVCALSHREVAVAKAEGIHIGRSAARLFERCETRLRNFGHSICECVHCKVRVIGKQRLAIRLSHDAHNAVGAATKLNRVSHS